jgi:3-hydroxyisobutyrate dehydrogenase-like beta-hydroxyacid dehydrogenase
MTTLGVVGLGAMGSRIAHRFMDSGHQVVAWNRTVEKAEALTRLGAKPAASPAGVADQVDVIITMVSDPGALRMVTEGPEGIATSTNSTLTVVEMSTVGPAAVSRLATVLPRGVGLLDAPVLGSTSEAESGELTVFVGGPTPLVERWRPLLGELGTVVSVGGLGHGAVAKLVANSTLLAVLTALGEAIALGERLGLRRDDLFDVLSRTPLAAQGERRRPVIEAMDFPKRFSLALARKDAELVVDAAGKSGLDLPVAKAAHRWLAGADEAGLGEHDYSAVLAHILDRRTSQ